MGSATLDTSQVAIDSNDPSCDCSWTHGGTTCGVNDGSHCWAVCCESDPSCDCSWTHGGTTCGVNDGSHCWSVCCGKTPSPAPSTASSLSSSFITEDCDCSWTHGGTTCGV